MFDIFNFQPQYNWYSNIRMTFQLPMNVQFISFSNELQIINQKKKVAFFSSSLFQLLPSCSWSLWAFTLSV